MKTGISLHDKLLGTSLEVGSRAANLALSATDYLGFTKAEHLRLNWQLGASPASAVEKWVTFEGTAAAGRTPNNYPDVGILVVSRSITQLLPESFGAKLAVAYGLGKTALMVGSMKSGDIFQPSEDHSQLSQVAMRIGPGDLQATAGLLTKRGSFVVLPDFLSAGPRMPLHELPPGISIV